MEKIKLNKEEMRKQLDELVRAFEQQFGVRCVPDPDREELEEEESYSRRYSVHGLIVSGAIDIDVEGWFQIHSNGSGDCLLEVDFGGLTQQNIYLQGWYTQGKWSKLEADDRIW